MSHFSLHLTFHRVGFRKGAKSDDLDLADPAFAAHYAYEVSAEEEGSGVETDGFGA